MIRLKVIFVENEALLALELLDLCQEFGCQVLGTARTAEEACLRLAPLHPDVLIADVDLGRGADGVDLAEALRRDDPALGIVFVTATQGPEKLARIAALQPSRLLRKPVCSEKLREALADASA